MFEAHPRRGATDFTGGERSQKGLFVLKNPNFLGIFVKG